MLTTYYLNVKANRLLNGLFAKEQVFSQNNLVLFINSCNIWIPWEVVLFIETLNFLLKD